MLKKTKWGFIIVLVLLVSSNYLISPSGAAVDVKKLKKEIVRLNDIITSKNKEIKALKAENAKLKQNSYKVSNTKVQYKLTVLNTRYIENNVSVPSLVEIKGVRYSPVKMVTNTLGYPTVYNKKKNTLYMGFNPDGMYIK